MGARQSLWTDIDALARLAGSTRATERLARGADRAGLTRPIGDTRPSLRRKNFEIHAATAPSRMVNGDYFDFFMVDRDTLAFVMADVSGKGMPAAVLMSFVRSMVRNVSLSSDSPGDTLARVNRMLYDANLGPMYVTIFFGWLDTRNGTLRYANAGHPLPYHVDHEGHVAPFCDVTGPILGILDVPRYGEKKVRLRAGERLVLYTDGVTEAESPEGRFFGAGRLSALLAGHAFANPAVICDEVLRGIEAFQGPHRHDDATVLVLQRKA